jgi:Flp pilus assembly protein TadG
MQRPSLAKFIRDDSGAVAATYAMALTGLIVAAGVAFDYGRLAAMDSELQNGADQAALAGATQLNGLDGACARASAAAVGLVNNPTVMGNSANTVTITSEPTCDATGSIKFWQNRDATVAATSNANARFIEVAVDARTVNYAFTPIAALMTGSASAGAMAGLGSSVCKVPPMMICSPDPVNPFNAAAKVGWGVQATGHGNDAKTGPGPGNVSTWAPGNFGFLEVGAGQNSDLIKSLAYTSVALDCAPIDGAMPETGNPQALYDAINTRFDIYDFNGGNGTTLAPCLSGSCPAAVNVAKDMVKKNNNTGGNNDCKIHGNGWQLPDEDEQFWPRLSTDGANGDGSWNDGTHTATIRAMGLPRDLCHYTSFGDGCDGGASGRFGDGNWARVDYFAKNHPGGERPASPGTITRYQTYRWEIANNNLPFNPTSGADLPYSRPICSTGSAGTIDRRVLTVAVVKNCASLSGASTAVVVDEWVDMFLVEPVVDARENGAIKDSIYMEVIGPSQLAGAGGGSAAQQIRRDVPYLVR